MARPVPVDLVRTPESARGYGAFGLSRDVWPAFALARAGDEAGAMPILEDLLEQVPNHPEALLLLGTIYRDAGEPVARSPGR